MRMDLKPESQVLATNRMIVIVLGQFFNVFNKYRSELNLCFSETSWAKTS